MTAVAMSSSNTPRLDSTAIAEPALEKMRRFHKDVISEIESAIAKHDVVVVGMAQNPHVKNVRKALAEAGIEFKYIEHGSYLSKWKERLAIKMWSGWPTFPQVFVRGVLLGGEDLTLAAVKDGSLVRSLSA